MRARPTFCIHFSACRHACRLVNSEPLNSLDIALLNSLSSPMHGSVVSAMGLMAFHFLLRYSGVIAL